MRSRSASLQVFSVCNVRNWHLGSVGTAVGQATPLQVLIALAWRQAKVASW